MKNTFRLFLAIALSASSIATAATDGIGCTGKIESLTIHSPDGVYLQLTNMNTVVKICDLGKTVGTSYAVSATQCKAVYSALLLALSTDRTMSILFDNVATGTHCSNFASWELATARNVSLVKQNQ